MFLTDKMSSSFMKTVSWNLFLPTGTSWNTSSGDNFGCWARYCEKTSVQANTIFRIMLFTVVSATYWCSTFTVMFAWIFFIHCDCDSCWLCFYLVTRISHIFYAVALFRQLNIHVLQYCQYYLTRVATALQAVCHCLMFQWCFNFCCCWRKVIRCGIVVNVWNISHKIIVLQTSAIYVDAVELQYNGDIL